jgi:septum formation inhibitor MinC
MVVERIRQLDQVGETSDVKVQPAAAAEKEAAVSQYVLDKRDSDLKILSRERGRLERSNQIEKESGGELERHHASRWQIAKNATEGKVNTGKYLTGSTCIGTSIFSLYVVFCIKRSGDDFVNL